jgi:hypothetical protein
MPVENGDLYGVTVQMSIGSRVRYDEPMWGAVEFSQSLGECTPVSALTAYNAQTKLPLSKSASR